MSGRQLSLSPLAEAELELVDAEIVTSAGTVASAAPLSPSPPPIRPALAERNLFGEAERIVARAASASTRRQYAGSSAPSATGLLGNSADRPWSAISTPTGPRSRHRRAWLLQ